MKRELLEKRRKKEEEEVKELREKMMDISLYWYVVELVLSAMRKFAHVKLGWIRMR